MSQEWIIHDSHQLFYRNPFGAVPCGSSITFRLKIVGPEEIQSAVLRMYGKDNAMDTYEMQPAKEINEERIYETAVETPAEPGLLWYYFIVIRGGQVYYYGNNSSRLGGIGTVQEQIPPSYQITVYKAGLSVPAWFQESVVYQIFVDRFFNGCADGKVLNPKKGALLHGNWDDTPVYVRDPQTNGILRWDFFGGNLEGVIKKLPYLQELGVSVLYFNPIFEAPSNHRYDTGDYKKIDSMLGTNEVFQKLCRKAENMGIRVILDGVFSHTGSDSIYFNREGTYPAVGAFQSRQSPYYSWYKFSAWPHFYESWWGIGTLPNVNEMDPSYQDFILGDEGVLRFWMEKGVKGWRLDVADELPDEFIKRLRRTMKKIDGDSLLLGEVWEDASNKISYNEQRQFLWGEELDSVMNYPFRRIMLDFFLGYQDARKVHQLLMSLQENYPRAYFYSALNLIGSHDVPRVLTILGEGKGEPLREVEKEKLRLSPEKRRLGIMRLKLLSLVQMTFPGVPAVYYGDEAGMEGYADPFNRGPYPWGHEDRELFNWYKKIISLRNRSEALRRGEWHLLYAQDDIYGYLRKWHTEMMAVIVNRNSKREAVVPLELGPWGQGSWVNLLKEQEQPYTGNKSMKVRLLPLEGKALEFRPFRF